MVAEEKVTTATMVIEATKKEVTDSVKQYKTLMEFEDEVQEVVCEAFIKGFEECKKKMAHFFHLPDLHDIIFVEPESDAGDVNPPAEAAPTEPTGLDQAEPVRTTLVAPPPVSQVATTALAPARWSSVTEAME